MTCSIKHTATICLLITLQLWAFTLYAQVIKGRVTDAETSKPIANANVYLNGTYVGTTTDSLGKFSLTASNTNIPLIVSYLGYASQTINNYAGKDLVIALKHKINELSEVVITADEMSREKKMKIFMTEFIGANNKDCVIANPDDVWLHYRKKTDELTAGADKPIIINNKRLGYRITYYLSNFRHNPLQTVYQGNYVFAEDTMGLKPVEIRKIVKARNEVYFGSRMHFIRSLWANELDNNNFRIYLSDKSNTKVTVIPGYHLNTDNQLGYNDLVVLQNDHIYHDQKFIVLNTEVYISYQKNKNTVADSFIKQSDGYTGTAIDRDGNYGQGIEWKGDMGLSRVNRLLPQEFQPLLGVITVP
ncbi:MAG: carboxypeptidase-like regulatory domain-containing protein [Bacteroidota bacterium]